MAELINAFFDELSAGWPDAHGFARVVIRLTLALLLSAIIGWEREREGKAAGLRTHMLVALGAAMFVQAAQENGASPDDMTRVVQGIATGIGFMGGGVILQLVAERRVKGLTTAAGLWLTAAIGVSAGLGRFTTAVLGTALCWMVLEIFHRIEKHQIRQQPDRDENADNSTGGTYLL